MIELVNALNFQNERKYFDDNAVLLELQNNVRFLYNDFIIEGKLCDFTVSRTQYEVMSNLNNIEITLTLSPACYREISDEKERRRAGLPVLLR